MVQINKSVPAVHNHEGGRASRVGPLESLKRTVSSCMLWEGTFYEDGKTVADRIKEDVRRCDPPDVAELAVKARTEMKLRHAPLLLVRELARHPRKTDGLVSLTLKKIIMRADELTEFLAIYWQDGKQPLSKQVKLGLAEAFCKFDEYRLAKYNRDTEIKLRDVLFLIHAKPKDNEQAEVWKRLASGELKAPDTWEVALSGGGDKRREFERLLVEGKMGYMALLRNLRNMVEAGVNKKLIAQAIENRRGMILPFRFISAVNAAPMFLRELDQAMIEAMEDLPRLPGLTNLLVDVSWSMTCQVSSKSKMIRTDAAAGLAIMAVAMCERVRVFTFSNALAEVIPAAGLALSGIICGSQDRGGTRLAKACSHVAAISCDADRTIIITDEQSHDGIGAPVGRGYIVNVGTEERGVGYGQYTHVHGFSENTLRFISDFED